MTFAAFREDDAYNWVSGNIFEIIFLIDVIVHFLLNFTNQKQSKTAKSIHLKSLLDTIKNYWEGDFIYDLIPLLPF